MRRKADKLEKGKWYADHSKNKFGMAFLKYSHSDNRSDIFSEIIGLDCYIKSKDGVISFLSGDNWFIPTPEDIEFYNLIDNAE